MMHDKAVYCLIVLKTVIRFSFDISQVGEFRLARPKRAVSAADRLAARSVDPLGFLIKQFKAEPSLALALELLPYQCPKLKTVDHTVQQDLEITVTIGGRDGA